MTQSLILQLDRKQAEIDQLKQQMLETADLTAKFDLSSQIDACMNELNVIRQKYIDWQISEVKKLEQQALDQ